MRMLPSSNVAKHDLDSGPDAKTHASPIDSLKADDQLKLVADVLELSWHKVQPFTAPNIACPKCYRYAVRPPSDLNLTLRTSLIRGFS